MPWAMWSTNRATIEAGAGGRRFAATQPALSVTFRHNTIVPSKEE